MSSLFRKFFGTSGDEADNDKKNDVKSPYAPDDSLPIDEQFTMHFINNGGKFIYCETLENGLGFVIFLHTSSKSKGSKTKS